MNTRRSSDLIQLGFVLLGAGLGLWCGLSFDWSGRLWLIGDVLAQFSWAIGLIVGALAGMTIGSLAGWLAARGNGNR